MEKRRNLVLFTGNSPRKLRMELSKWIKLFESKYGEGNSVRIESGSFAPEMVVTELLSPPFFSEKRLVVFEGIPRRRAEKEHSGGDGELGKGGMDAVSKIEAAVLSSLSLIPDTTVVVFISEESDPRSELLKRLVSEGDVRRFDSWDAIGAENFIRHKLPGLDAQGCRELTSRAAGNDDLLADAVERLSLAYGEKPIGVTQVDEALPKALESDIFILAEAVASMDIVKALTLLRGAMKKESPRRIFPVIMGEIRKTLYISALRDSGISVEGIQESLEMKSRWGIDKRKILSTSAKARLFTLYERLVQFDAASKTGNAPWEDDEIFENGLLSAMLGKN